MNELGWIASLLGIGGLAGTIASGWIADRIGRKFCLLAMAIPQIVINFFCSGKLALKSIVFMNEKTNISTIWA